MPITTVYSVNTVTITINGVVRTGIIRSYENRAGSVPASAIVDLPTESAYSVVPADWEGKTARLTVDGNVILDGHVWRVMTSLSTNLLSLKVLDKRQLLNSDWVGRRHLGPDGLRVLGADVIFNKDGKGNKDIDTGIYLDAPVPPDFVYNKGNVDAPEDCEVEDADFWTYGDIIDWLWRNYVDDLEKPTIPKTAGLEREAEEINLFGVPVGEALDQVFSRTQASWRVEWDSGRNDSHVIIFCADEIIDRRDMVPLPERTMRLGDPANPDSYDTYVANTNDDGMLYPSRFDVERDNESVVTDIYIVAGKTIREIEAKAEDFLDPTLETTIVPRAQAAPVFLTQVALEWSWNNYSDDNETWVHLFDKSRYELHGAGKDIRRKDKAKPILGSLLLRRNREGNFVEYDSECATNDVGTEEQLALQYYGGGSFDLDRAAITAQKNSTVDGDEPPERCVHDIETELREYVVAEPVGGRTPRTPSANPVRRAVLREEFRHKTREEVSIIVPVSIAWTINVDTNSHSWTATIPVELPVTPDFALSGSGTITPYTNPPPFKPTMVLPEAVVDDATVQLNRIKEIVGNEAAKVVSTIQGELPSWTNLKVGEKIITSPANAYGAQNTEVVLGVSFDGSTQALSFFASNIVGPNAIALAGAFINAKRNRNAPRSTARRR